MATKDVPTVLELSTLERNYVSHGLSGLKSSLQRQISKEQNPDILRYRRADLSAVEALLGRLGGV